MDLFRKHSILPTDIVLFAYLALTTIYMLIFNKAIPEFWQLLGARFLIVLVMSQIIYLHKITHSPWIENLHILFPLVLTAYLYGETHSLNHLIFHENLDPFFVQLDQKIFGMQPSLAFSTKFNKHFFGELMYLGYISYYFQMIILALYALIKRKNELDKTVFLIFTAFVLYYTIFSFLPVVGPQFHLTGTEALPPHTGPISEFMMIINHNFEKPTGAFPSSHVGMTLIFSHLAFRLSKKLFFVFLPFSFLILFATVYIKAHYAVDVIGGIITAPIFYWISLKLYRAFQKA